MRTAIAILVWLSLARCATAALVLDQSYSPASASQEAIINTQLSPIEWAQTFTVGITGSLVELNLKVYKQGTTEPLLVDIRTVDAMGFPTESNAGPNVLSSVSVDPSQVGDSFLGAGEFVRVSLNQPVSVNVGDQLAIVLRSTQPAPSGSPSYRWQGNSGDNYASGQSFLRSSGGWGTHNSDRAFQTFVGVPEPASLAFCLLALGVGTIVRSSRRPQDPLAGDLAPSESAICIFESRGRGE